ncbi:hypothetical protein KAR91_03855, partial [Candidatus Pacearchaeota archaeon]|nr:hypothetical protein [Candidatus Pacearchaeota archaeon]
AESEQQVCGRLFSNTLDQDVHGSDDYKRIRNFLIDWYASHRTITSTQKNISDPYSLPSEHLNELIRSFGFPHGLDLVPLRHKVNMFLDLVNLYKKKGTPEALADILDYFGFSDSDVVEYWLEKNQFGNLVFKGRSVRRSASGSTALLDEDVPYNKLTVPDPHWFLTESQTEALIGTNDINIPSKSPYFALSSIFLMSKMHFGLSMMSRVVQEQYTDKVINGNDIIQNVYIKGLGEITSLLEVYLATTYVFHRMFSPAGGVGSNFMCFNGTIEYNTADPPSVVNLPQKSYDYDNLIAVPPTSRADRDAKLIQYFDEWSRPYASDFLTAGTDTAENLLQTLNPGLKQIVENWFATGEETFLITFLLGSLDNWLRANIDSRTPSLVITTLGFSFQKELLDLINFFKPYHARLAFLDTAYAIRNPLTESIRVDDGLFTDIYHTHQDTLNFSDDTFTDITQYIFDIITGEEWQSHYDTGAYYDTVITVRDELLTDVYQTHQDTIVITDALATQSDHIIVENINGEFDGPSQWDLGDEFDTPIPAPSVRDHVIIDIWPPYPYFTNIIEIRELAEVTDHVEQIYSDHVFSNQVSITDGLSSTIHQSPVESIPVTDGLTLLNIEVLYESHIDWVGGGGGPVMWDMDDHEFDVEIAAPVCVDNLIIGVRYFEQMTTTCLVQTDASAGLDIGVGESFTSTATIESSVSSVIDVNFDMITTPMVIESSVTSSITIGVIESLTSTTSIESVISSDLTVGGVVEEITSTSSVTSSVSADLILDIYVTASSVIESLVTSNLEIPFTASATIETLTVADLTLGTTGEDLLSTASVISSTTSILGVEMLLTSTTIGESLVTGNVEMPFTSAISIGTLIPSSELTIGIISDLSSTVDVETSSLADVFILDLAVTTTVISEAVALADLTIGVVTSCTSTAVVETLVTADLIIDAAMTSITSVVSTSIADLNIGTGEGLSSTATIVSVITSYLTLGTTGEDLTSTSAVTSTVPATTLDVV